MERILFSPGGATALKQDDILTSLASVLAELQQKLETGGQVALDAATLAALEGVSAVVSGTVALDAPTLAALETINAVVSGEVALNAVTLAALETINAAVTGTVAVSNHPADFPLPSAQILTLTPQTNALTDGQLRAATVPVSGPLTDAALRATPVPVSGTVTVGNFPATQPVSAASLPLPSGAGTEATLALIRAKTDNLDVALSTRAVTGLTDVQLRAAAVPVSGTVTAFGPLTDSQLRASAVSVSSATLAADASVIPIKNRFSPSSGTPVTVSSSGATVVHTPAVGMRIRLKWLGLSSPDTNTATNLVDVKLGGNLIYRWDIGKPGAFAHGTVREGPVDGALSVETSAAQTLRVNMDLEEF